MAGRAVMSPESFSDNPEQLFEQEQLLRYAENAFNHIAPVFLGDKAEEMREHLSYEIRRQDLRGTIVPTASFNNQTRILSVIVEPDTIMAYADEIADEINHGIEEADIARLLVGAGVARTILGWKTMGTGLHDPKEADRYKELICKRDYLWEEVSQYDDANQTNIRAAVERLGDDQLLRVNWLRFSIGASLRHTSDASQLQQAFVKYLQAELMQKENERKNDLHFNLGWLETDSAFDLYDDQTPEIELAFSFPMSPAEEQRFLDY